MNVIKLFVIAVGVLMSTLTHAWEAKVTRILQHDDFVAVYLDPDPGPLNCATGQPYLLVVDGTPGSEQRFSMLLTAISGKMTVSGYADACNTAIWGNSRPTIERLNLVSN